MFSNYIDDSLVEIDRSINKPVKKIELGGELSFESLISTLNTSVGVSLTTQSKIIKRIKKSHEVMLQNIKDGVPVYGTNSSFGGQAARVITQGGGKKRYESAKKISDSLVFLDVGVGPEVPAEIVRLAMVIRINMLMQGVSGVGIDNLKKYLRFINLGLTPVVNSFGGIGASGDLTHNQRVVDTLRGLVGTEFRNNQGKIEKSKNTFTRYKIKPLNLRPKEGLGFVNGDNFSTAYAAVVVKRLIECFLVGQISSAMAVEVLKGSNRSFHPLLSQVRPHPGQKESSDNYRYLLDGSKLALQELQGHSVRDYNTKVQDGYSIRCLPQFEGPMIEKLKSVLNTITINANSVSDNPLWVPEEYTTKDEKPWQWVSGGNFLAMHMVEVLDSMRKITTQLIKRNDRLLSRMIDTSENNGLPANLSIPESIDHCTFKGVQIQSGMLEIYSTVLANPVSTLFGVHEERNQDITSHAVTSGILAMQNLELLEYSLAGNLLAVAQGVDLRGGPRNLSKQTRPMYDLVRENSKTVKENRPLSKDIFTIARLISNGEMMSIARKEIFNKI